MSEGEFAAIERLRARFATHAPQISTGIGDDAAVLRAQGQVVLSVDTQVEGVHFDRAWLTLADIGYRATASAFSREVLAATFDVPERLLPAFPFTPADPLIVPRRNPVDPVARPD